jgi:hypothetical protein
MTGSFQPAGTFNFDSTSENTSLPFFIHKELHPCWLWMEQQPESQTKPIEEPFDVQSKLAVLLMTMNDEPGAQGAVKCSHGD